MKKLFSSLIILSLAACSGVDSNQQYPMSKEDAEEARVGKLTGDDGILVFGGKSKSKATDGITVNAYLWRATLDVVHKLPVTSADPFGGTVLTDWYKLSPNANERYKVNVFLTSAELRSDAVKVATFKQALRGGAWVDVQASPSLADELESKILDRARELKISSGK